MANISELIPAGIGMIIFTVISFITLSTLMYQKNMRKYSVYYMYGLTWHNIFKIHITYIFMIIFAALIFGIVAIYAVHSMGIWNMTNVNVGVVQVAGCLVTMVLLMFVASLMCLSMVNGKSQRELCRRLSRMFCLKNIVKTYNKGKSNEYEALHGISMEVKDSELTAIIGTPVRENLLCCIFLHELTDMIQGSIRLT